MLKLFEHKNFNLYFALFTFFVIAFIYANSLRVPFTYDDSLIIQDNIKIKYPENLSILTDARFFADITFAFNYFLHKENVFGYHLINTLIHFINVLLVYFLSKTILTLPKLNNYFQKKENIIASITALLFATHPIQTQAVTYIIQRYTSLGALFYFATIILYLKARLHTNKNKKVLFYLLTVTTTILAFKTKQNTFTLPIMILFTELFFFTTKENFKNNLQVLFPFFAVIFLLPFLLLITTGLHQNLFFAIDNLTRETLEIDRSTYLFTQFSVILTYIKLLFLPFNQSLYYEYPLNESFFAFKTFFSFTLLLLIISSTFYFIYKSVKRNQPHYLLPTFGILFFFIALSIESSIIPIKDVIFEHRLYLPSFGFFLFIVSSIIIMVENFKLNKKYVIYFLLFISLIFSALTVKRNVVWQDNIRIWENVLDKYPNSFKAYTSIGGTYLKRGNLTEAKENFIKALKINPNYSYTLNNLGSIYDLEGDYKKAFELYSRAQKANPKYAPIHSNIGNLYLKLSDFNNAVTYLEKAVALDKNLETARYNLGLVYLNLNDNKKAVDQFKYALKLIPVNPDAYNNLGVSYLNLNNKENAIKAFKMALIQNPTLVYAAINLANIYEEKGEREKADKMFTDAIKENPFNDTLYLFYGRILKKRNNLIKANAMFRKALEVNPMSEARKEL